MIEVKYGDGFTMNRTKIVYRFSSNIRPITMNDKSKMGEPSDKDNEFDIINNNGATPKREKGEVEGINKRGKLLSPGYANRWDFHIGLSHFYQVPITNIKWQYQMKYSNLNGNRNDEKNVNIKCNKIN